MKVGMTERKTEVHERGVKHPSADGWVGTRPDLGGPWGPGPMPPTNRGLPTKSFQLYFSLMIDAYCIRDYDLVVAHC